MPYATTLQGIKLEQSYEREAVSGASDTIIVAKLKMLERKVRDREYHINRRQSVSLLNMKEIAEEHQRLKHSLQFVTNPAAQSDLRKKIASLEKEARDERKSCAIDVARMFKDLLQNEEDYQEVLSMFSTEAIQDARLPGPLAQD